MADIHIDEFYQDCLKTLIQLYNAFPRLTTVYVDDLISNAGTDEFGIPNRRHKACFDTLLWLASEGYIRYQDNIRQDALDQVALTEKSFLRLSLPTFQPALEDQAPNLPPLVARKQSTLAWQCREALKDKGSDAIAAAAQKFFTAD
ncbi:hypothetical protein [Endozoicomonas ascidiicola]|uniref:hypothetical protein n=1 Tax=Endozoicomonas ascidiicola TaxID=1698521 RepID=UPI00082AADFD|nr:hypothetical protein [Endozoicomonas ascidiicola]